MGWRHPDISLDDLVLLIKGFVDILILANGYLSSGLPATWDAANIQNAVRWGLFFEDVFKRLSDSTHYEDSVKELDEALRNLISHPSFPQGLVYLSSSSLCKARDLVIGYLVQSHHLGVKNLTALLTAIIEMDVKDQPGIFNENPAVYVDNLMLHMESLISMEKGNLMKSAAASTSSSTNFSGVARARKCNSSISESKENNVANHSCFLILEILKRQASMSCTSSAEAGLASVLKLVTKECTSISDTNPLEVISTHCNYPENILLELFLWSQWRSRCLSYLADKRTIKMLSGAKLIFSTPKAQWFRVLEPLKVSSDASNDHLLEILEISLLGFISRRWSDLIGKFMSHFCDYLSISEQYYHLHCLLQDNFQCAHFQRETLSSEEKDIIEYVTTLLDSQYHKLWLLPPVLVAAAIPLWSIMFRAFWNEIERQFLRSSYDTRCQDSGLKGYGHKDCIGARLRAEWQRRRQREATQRLLKLPLPLAHLLQPLSPALVPLLSPTLVYCRLLPFADVAERIRCLYAFHVSGIRLKADYS